ncbi:conserved Plasmodium protein, unknown function [Plasmodium vinckei vinckei]|uniref:Uncharacterized protein n=1 Tax=Plasmodium vinckei vinckei TaxID=54757 RepID=A0A081IAE9_PLAVN|nr:conserved Plasmodium protein, unknown function [Plasmodium vinckei vinckei]KEG00657.1 hypothetical protein YYE_04488 [Plasmodium vinckei vinckei]VEV54650.1 conserved Plasmodium protein, unknown function [Plasmodium vinckei vinckei]
MGDIDNVLISIKKIESIKEYLTQFNNTIQNEFGYFCGIKNRTINLGINLNEFDQTIFKRLYSSWRMEDLNNFNGKSVIRIMERNPYVIFFLYFLFIFIIVYLTSFILYTKCFRRLLKKLFNSSKNDSNNKDKEEEWAKSNKANRNSVSTNSNSIKDNYNNELDELNNINENAENNNVIKIVKKRGYRIIMNLIICCFLSCLICLGVLGMAIFIDVQKGINMNICGLSKTIEKFLVDKCPDTKNVNSECYSLEHVVTDAISIMNQYQTTKEFIKDKTNYNTNQTFPVILRYKTGFNMLKVLRNNIDKNNKKLEEGYLHTYPVLKVLRESLDNIITKGDTLLSQAESIIDTSKNEISKIFNDVDNTIISAVNKNVPDLKTKIDHLERLIKSYDKKFKIRYILNKFTAIMMALNIMIILFSLIILIIMLASTYFVIKGKSMDNKYISDLFGCFSGAFGFLAIIVLALGTTFLILSVLGGTSCIISDRILKNEFTFDFLSENKIGYCLKNPNGGLIDRTVTSQYMKSLDSLNTTDLYNSIAQYNGDFDKIKGDYKKQSTMIKDFIWVIIPTDNNEIINQAKAELVKTSLQGTCITRENVQFADYQLMGINSYMTYLNRIGFTEGYGMCFEDDSCANDNKKYNINYDSKVTDEKYITVRNKKSLIYSDEDVDSVLQIMALKSKINKDKIFDISDLDGKKTEKITWKEYTPQNEPGGNKTSIVQTYFEKSIEYINFEIILTLLREVSEHINIFKNLIIEKSNSLIENTKCSRLINLMANVRHNYCDNGILRITRLSVILISCGLVSFCLWYLFLFFWIYYQMKII